MLEQPSNVHPPMRARTRPRIASKPSVLQVPGGLRTALQASRSGRAGGGPPRQVDFVSLCHSLAPPASHPLWKHGPLTGVLRWKGRIPASYAVSFRPRLVGRLRRRASCHDLIPLDCPGRLADLQPAGLGRFPVRSTSYEVRHTAFWPRSLKLSRVEHRPAIRPIGAHSAALWLSSGQCGASKVV